MLVVSLLLVWTVYAVLRFFYQVPLPLRGPKTEAAQRMQVCLDVLFEQKTDLGIPIDVRTDRNCSGIIGEEYTDITTTLGSLPSKRTAATPDMAAMAVHMLSELNLQPGQTVAVNMSGSFPGLNIAFSCAIDVLDLQGIYIASVGASSYGANQLCFTYPVMHDILYRKGLVKAPLVGASVGGGRDVGLGLISQKVVQTLVAAF